MDKNTDKQTPLSFILSDSALRSYSESLFCCMCWQKAQPMNPHARWQPSSRPQVVSQKAAAWGNIQLSRTHATPCYHDYTRSRGQRSLHQVIVFVLSDRRIWAEFLIMGLESWRLGTYQPCLNTKPLIHNEWLFMHIHPMTDFAVQTFLPRSRTWHAIWDIGMLLQRSVPYLDRRSCLLSAVLMAGRHLLWYPRTNLYFWSFYVLRIPCRLNIWVECYQRDVTQRRPTMRGIE